MPGSVSWVLGMQVQAGRSDELRALLEEMVSNTHAHEPGTVYGSPDAAVRGALSVLRPTYMGLAVRS